MKIYRIAKEKEYLTPEEREEVKAKFKDIQCSFAKDDKGYYCYTHRARSDSYSSIAEIPQSKVDFINSTSAVKRTLVKAAVTDGEFRDAKDSIKSVKDDIRDVKKDVRDFESRMKKMEKEIDGLNVGNRMFSQNKTMFTSLQRKIERMDAVIQEWKNYKRDMDDNIKKQVEKHTRARIGEITPQSF